MKLLNPATRRLIPAAVFCVLLMAVLGCWHSLQFVHWDAQYRSMDPQHYIVEVVTATDYHNLADPANREVKLSNGHTIQKAPIWEETILPKYKPTDDGRFYVLVTTKGTAHVLPYVSGYLFMFGFFAVCGLVLSLWNSRQKI